MKSEIKNTIDKFLKEIEKMEFFSKVEFIILYGSHLSDYHHSDSDIDLCIYIKGEERNLAGIRLNLLKKIDGKFDIQMFQLLPLYVQIEVLKGEPIHIKNEDLLYEVAYNTIEEYEDFYPFYSDYINR